MAYTESVRGVVDALPSIEFLTQGRYLHRLSQDFHWFSPVLKAALADKAADAIAKPKDQGELKAVVGACAKRGIPITIRGGGTGNYGQCVPLDGGVVIDMTQLNAIRWIEGGVARVESGTKLLSIDAQAREQGWEMRLLPSTYRMATAGGFYGGGFGGVGSISWGSLRDPGNVLAVRALSAEPEPRELEFRDAEALDLYHAYGINGIITEIEFALAPAYQWIEAVPTFDSFMDAMRFSQEFATSSGVVKRMLTPLADPVPQYCGLGDRVDPGRHAVLVIAARPGMEFMRSCVACHGGQVAFEQDGNEAFGTPKSVIEHSWNHTTLHSLKKDRNITYLQSGFRPWENLAKVEQLYHEFGDELMWHLEYIRADGAMTCSGLQLVHYRDEARLNEIIQYHRDQGVHIANPHTYILEDGGKMESDPRQLAMKRELDPQGLLNPGKMRAWQEAAA